MKIKREGIYTTHGRETKLIATKAKVDGVRHWHLSKMAS